MRTATGTRPALWREAAVGLAVFGAYLLVDRLGGPARRTAALDHARDLLHVEQTLGIDVEHSLNSWLLGHDTLRVAANYEYAFTYVLSAFLLLGWLYVKRPDIYPWARTSFIVVNLLAIGCFLLYPVMPPRMLPGFSDTVTQGHTFGSWGNSTVDHANALAAMPSLHLGWALWVSVVLGLIAGSLLVQGLSLAHVLVTLLVITATANHFLLDAGGGALCVLVAMPVAGLITRRPGSPAPDRVAPADAFFLYVETPAAPQVVGGLLVLDATGPEATAALRDRLERQLRDRLETLPRFHQRLEGGSRWRRAHWCDAEAVDWSWHVFCADPSPAAEPVVDEERTRRRLGELVAELQSTPLPRDRPLWRVAVVPDVAPGLAAVVIVVHHVIADGLGTVEAAVTALLDPALPRPVLPAGPGRLARAAAIATGLAQLATDGRPSWQAAGCDTAERSFATVALPLAEVRRLGRDLDVRVTDVVLALVAAATAGSQADPAAAGSRLRVSVTLAVPGGDKGGNATAAVMVDAPLDAPTEPDRLAAIAARGARSRSGSRAIASRFVMDTVGGALPPITHAWFARTVYGHRFFHAIVSNMPGPRTPLTCTGLPLRNAYPILPLAPGSPVAVGALSVDETLNLGVSLHPAFVSDPAAFEAALLAAYEELVRAAARRDASRAESTRAR